MRITAALSALALGLLLTSSATALPVYGTDASGELNGSRNVGVGGGLTGYNDYAQDVTVTWSIDFGLTTPGKWHYEYSFSGLAKDISHFVLDLSDDCVFGPDPACVTDARLDSVLIDAEDLELGDLDAITGGIKFDVGGGEGVTYSFDSNRAPVYGHLAVKDGGGPSTCADAPGVGDTHVACSNGLLAGTDTMDPNDYVARPNGAVPEPSIALLMAVSLLGLAGRRTLHARD